MCLLICCGDNNPPLRKPKLPSADKLTYGEIAINFADGYETISTLNSLNEVVPFSSDEYYSKQKLGTAFTGSNSAKTVTDAINVLSQDKADKTELKSNYVTIDSFKSHSENQIIHVTEQDKENWNSAYLQEHSHDNKSVLDTFVSAGTSGTFTNVKTVNGIVTSGATMKVNAGNGLTGGGALSSDVTISMPNVGTSGTYTTVKTDQFGRVSSGAVYGLTVTQGLSGGGSFSGDIKVGLATTGTAGTYTTVKTDQYGRVTSGGVHSLSAEHGISGGGQFSDSIKVGLEPTGNSGTYTTVKTDQFGRVTSGGVVSVSADGVLSGGGNLTSNVTISHNTNGTLGAGTTSPSTSQTPSFGGTFNIPVVNYDKYGHITGSTTASVTIPSTSSTWGDNYYVTGASASTTATNNKIDIYGNNSAVGASVTLSAASATAAGLMTADDKKKLDGSAQLSALTASTNYTTVTSAKSASTASYALSAGTSSLALSAQTVPLSGVSGFHDYHITGGSLSTAATTNTLTLNGNGGGASASVIFNAATTTAAGLMTSTDKSNLDSAVPKSRKISTASGLTGGGDLSSDRTIGLLATGTSGTYVKVTTDVYGRVTSGSSNISKSDISDFPTGSTGTYCKVNTSNGIVTGGSASLTSSDVSDFGNAISGKVSTSVQVTGTNGLTGGGALTGNVSISHATAFTQTGQTSPNTPTTSSTVNVPVIKYDKYGHITATTSTTVVVPGGENWYVTGASASTTATSVKVGMYGNNPAVGGSVTLGAATTGAAGVMTADDKKKLDASVVESALTGSSGYITVTSAKSASTSSYAISAGTSNSASSAGTASLALSAQTVPLSGVSGFHDYYVTGASASTTSSSTTISIYGNNSAVGGSVTLNAATNVMAGLMSALDKTALSDASNLEEVSYYNVTQLISHNSLVPGKWYAISYTPSANDSRVGPIEFNPSKVIVMAVSNNRLSHDGYYYAPGFGHGDTGIGPFKIKYDVNNDTNKYAWAVSNGTGVIYWMQDNNGNEAPYDFVNIRFKRYSIGSVTGTSSAASIVQDKLSSISSYFMPLWGDSITINGVTLSPSSSYSAVSTFALIDARGEYTDPWSTNSELFKNNVIEPFYEEGSNTQILNNVVICCKSGGVGVIGNKFEFGCADISIYSNSFVGCKLIGDLNPSTIIMDGTFYQTDFNYIFSSLILDNVHYSHFKGLSQHNIFVNHVEECEFSEEISHNNFINKVRGCTFGSEFRFNEIGLTLSGGTFSGNSFGNGCCYNTFKDDCMGNSFGTLCSGNTLGKSAKFNMFGNNCNDNDIVALKGVTSCYFEGCNNGNSDSVLNPGYRFIYIPFGISNQNLDTSSLVTKRA